MASGRMEFHADSIMQHANFTFVLPNDVEMEEVRDKRHYERPAKNLILLHGLTGTDTDWLYGGNAQLMAIQYNLNIFMPTTGNSFYLNKGYKGGEYADFIGKELPEYIGKTFGLDMKRDNNIVGGLSMGGYGALHTALAYPENFSACIALSSALIVKGLAQNGLDGSLSVTPAKMLGDIFGDPEDILESGMNPEKQYRDLRAKGAEIPKIYFAVGTEDYLITDNHEFRDFLEEQKADYIYEEGPGKHDWFFWNEYLDRGLRQILDPEA